MQELSDNDILSYLMSSEINEGFTSEEFKFLLFKFRYFYRLTHSKNESLKYQIDNLANEINSLSEQKKIEIKNLISQNQQLEIKYNSLINKKLTWRERIKGKIIIKEDETNGIQKI